MTHPHYCTTVGGPRNRSALFMKGSNSSYHSPPDHPSLAGWSTTYFILCVFAACTNMALLTAVIRDRNSTVATRILIGNLTVAALLLSAVFFPGAAVAILARSYASTQQVNFCPIFSAILFTVQASACWAEVCIAFNRLIAICFPHHYNSQWKGKRSSIILVSCAWLICVMIGVLVGTGTGARIVSLPDGNCGMRASNDFGQFLIYSVNIIPYGIASLCSVMIFATVWRRARTAKVSAKNDRQDRQVKRRLVIARAISASIIWCLVCTIPLMIMTTKFPHLIAKDPGISRWLKLLYVSEYAVNPVVFIGMSSAYRAALRLPCQVANSTRTDAHSRFVSHASRTRTIHPSRRQGLTNNSVSMEQ